MQTIKLNLYNIDELAKEAQEKAHQDYITSTYFEYFWLDESIESVKAFCNAFNCDLVDYQLDSYGHSFLKANIDNDCVRGMKKKDLPAKDSELTGYIIDFVMLESFHKHYKSDIIEAFNIALDDGLKAIINDMEYQESMEYFIEHSEANEYQYTIDGGFYS